LWKKQSPKLAWFWGIFIMKSPYLDNKFSRSQKYSRILFFYKKTFLFDLQPNSTNSSCGWSPCVQVFFFFFPFEDLFFSWIYGNKTWLSKISKFFCSPPCENSPKNKSVPVWDGPNQINKIPSFMI
jgi:hypothetical protein